MSAAEIPPPGAKRAENIALLFQEAITVIVRLRMKPSEVTNPDAFRSDIHSCLMACARRARDFGQYSVDDIKLATFAIVAFLDESVLNSKNDVFREWQTKPLQEKLFGTHMAGNVFFERVDSLLQRDPSEDLADVLEVYYLCLVLGFRGRFRPDAPDLRHYINRIAEKIRGIRGGHPVLSHSAPIGLEPVHKSQDNRTKIFALTALLCFIVAASLYGTFWFFLHSGVTEISSTPAAMGVK